MKKRGRGRRMVVWLGLACLELVACLSIGCPARVAPSPEGPKLRDILQPGQGHAGIVWCVAFSPDGQTLAAGSAAGAGGPGEIKLWDIASRQNTATLPCPGIGVLSVAFSPDGKTLASGCTHNSVKLWDVATGKEKATLPGHAGSVGSVAFSPDGKTLASAGINIKLWDMPGGQNTATFPCPDYPTESVAFGPDSKMLASGNHDTTVRLWDVASGNDNYSCESAVLSMPSPPSTRTPRINPPPAGPAPRLEATCDVMMPAAAVPVLPVPTTPVAW